MINSIHAGVGGDQKEIVENITKPVAVICAGDEIGINNSYIQNQVAYGNLWGQKIYFIKGGHCAFWKNFNQFNKILFQFLHSINSLN